MSQADLCSRMCIILQYSVHPMVHGPWSIHPRFFALNGFWRMLAAKSYFYKFCISISCDVVSNALEKLISPMIDNFPDFIAVLISSHNFRSADPVEKPFLKPVTVSFYSCIFSKNSITWLQTSLSKILDRIAIG